MALMDRLKGTFFLAKNPTEQQEQIAALQLLRTNEIKLAATVRSKPRKTKTKKTTKRKVNLATNEEKAKKLLASLSPGQLANIKQLLGE